MFSSKCLMKCTVLEKGESSSSIYETIACHRTLLDKIDE